MTTERDLARDLADECTRGDAAVVLTVDDTVLMMAPGLGPAVPLTPALVRAWFELSRTRGGMSGGRYPSGVELDAAATEAVDLVRERLHGRIARDLDARALSTTRALVDAEAELARAQAAARAVAATRAGAHQGSAA